jgi:hypothetical protein
MMKIFTGYGVDSIAPVGVQIKLRSSTLATLATLATNKSGAPRTTDSPYTVLNTRWVEYVYSISPVTSPEIIGASIWSTIRISD